MFTLVLGGGGSAGIGWETGVLYGLAQQGCDLRGAANVIGTSAGSIVGVRLRTGTDLGELYDAELGPVSGSMAEVDFPALQQRWAQATAGVTSAAQARQRIADLAVATATMSPAERRGEIAALLPVDQWPQQPFAAVSVNGATGDVVAITREAGVDLLDAVAASCAVPCVWPPVRIGGTPHVDGAVRSPTNADLAGPASRVVVIAPMPPATGIDRELARLPEGTRHAVIAADTDALRAFGTNPLDPRCGPAAARAGLRKGRAAAARVAAVLG